MSRSIGHELPAVLQPLLDGSDLANRQGLTFLLLTNDESGWPQVAMLSVGEVVAVDPRTLRAALWLGSGTTRNLSRTGRGTLMLVADGNGYYVRVSARRTSSHRDHPGGVVSWWHGKEATAQSNIRGPFAPAPQLRRFHACSGARAASTSAREVPALPGTAWLQGTATT